MNVRNIRQYITNICGKDTLGLLGSNKEILLQTIDGKSQAQDQVEAFIAGIASFASNAEEQLFYEFVQNAYDAHANSLFFYANEQYLIVLNNGEPFFTDFDIFESKSIRDGQLYNFLAKGKSLKRNDVSKLGKYGQGSKLLYTLLTNESESEENEDLLIKTIYKEKKGPYLISWYNRNQLANLLQEQDKWVPSRADDYRNNILFVKILMSYYPIDPDTSEELFSKKEALDAVNAFDILVDPRRNLHFLDKGTAIIIPLGKGKYDKITSENNLDKVRTRLGGFASITKNQERNAGRSVEHIYVMGEEIDQYDVQSVFVDFEVEGKKFDYHFAFNPIFAEKNFVNLFKGLPILETKLQLGFIVDSQKFDVDDSRQRIIDKEKTQGQLVKAFTELVKKLESIKKSDPEKFDYIYKAILATKYLNGDDFKFIKNAFQKVFVPFLDRYVLTSGGKYEQKCNVREFVESLQIPLSKIGITKYQWINLNFVKELHRHRINPEVIDFSTLICDAEDLKLSAWIKSLPFNDYASFFNILNAHKHEINVINRKLFRTNKGNLYSYKELISTANVYFPFQEGMKFGECEHINEIISDIEESRYRQILFDKIKTNIESFRISDSLKDDVAVLLAWIGKNNEYYTTKIKREICLLQNWHDSYESFENLFLVRPKDTILFDNYSTKGYVPEVIKSNNWLLNPTKAKKACWHWIVKNWQTLQDNESWGYNTHVYIANIKTVYQEGVVDGSEDKTKLTLYLNEEGIPSKELCVIVNNVTKLSEDEFYYLETKVPHLHLMPYKYYKELMETPFYVEIISSEKIVNDGLKADEKLLRIFIKITDGFLQKYRTQEFGDNFVITKTSGGYNYIDSVTTDLQTELYSANFYRIPTKVQELLRAESGKYKFASNETMLIKAIEKISNPIKLLPFVKQANTKVVDHFFKKLKAITIDNKLNKEDLRWQVIVFAAQRKSEESDYVNNVFDLIRYKAEKLPSSITQRYVSIGKNVYDVYLLDKDIEKDNQAIDSFLKCLPSQNEMDYFKEYYYEGKEEAVSVEDLYKKLTGYYLSVEQLRFCLNYALANDDKYDDLEINENVDLADALDMILANNFEGFDNHFKIEGLNFDSQVYANHDILLEQEYIPKELNEWLDKNPAGLNLFRRLVTFTNPFIAVRQALLNDEFYSDTSCFTESEATEEIDRTINWSIAKRISYVYESDRFKTMMSIIENLPVEYETMPFLRYTGKVIHSKDKIMKPAPIFTLERYQEGGSFLSYLSWAGDLFQNRLCNSSKLATYIKENVVYVYGDKELLLNHGYKKKTRWKVQTSVSVLDYPELDDPVYRNWKTMKESKGITIHTSKSPIIMNFNIMSTNTSVFTDKLDDSEYGFELGKRIVIQQPNKDGLTLMKTIAKYISNIEFFKEPFIALQALYVDKWELLQQEKFSDGESNGEKEDNGKSNIDLSNSPLTEKQAQEAVNKISIESVDNIEYLNTITKQMNSEELEKLNNVAEPIKELMRTLEKEDIERLAQKKEKLKKILKDFERYEEEEKESQVRQIIGFIGELIYSHYLENKNKEFVHAALEGVGDYDFEIKTDNLFVDVKTTLYSLKDGTAPFYLHKSQNIFMKKHPDAKYHIIRISLMDLNLKKSYVELRNVYGKDANPMEDSNLRKRCEQIAKQYWRGTKIEEFDALSPEYAIRIEPKN